MVSGGWFDGPVKPTAAAAPRLKIETGGRCRHAVVSIGSTFSNRAKVRQRWKIKSRGGLSVCIVCQCLTKQDISDDGLLWSCSDSTRDEKRQHQGAGRTRGPTQGLPTESRILLTYLYSDPTSTTADKTAGQSLIRSSWESRGDGTAWHRISNELAWSSTY